MRPTQLLEKVYFYNTATQWGVALAIALGAYLFLAISRRLLVSRIGAIAKRTSTGVDDALVELVRKTRAYFMVTVAVVLATRFLTLPPRTDDYLRVAFVIALLAQCGAWGTAVVTLWVQSQVARRSAQADIASAATMRALGVAVKVVLWSILFITGLHVFGVDVTALVTGLGIGGIAIALAVQNVLGDLLAALAIVLDKPFLVGDAINVDTINGTVEHIGLKTTRLRSLSGEQVIISNGDLLKSRIRNYRRMYERRVAFFTDVAYDTPPEVVAAIPAIIREAVTSHQPIRFDRSHFVAYTDSTLRFETVYYVLDPDYGKYLDIQQAVNLTLLRRFAADGIRFAFPTRTVQLEGQAVDLLVAAAGDGRVAGRATEGVRPAPAPPGTTA